MNPEDEILEKWVEKLADSHPQNASALRAPSPDPFRNPVGFATRRSLEQLWEQLQGDMNPAAIDSALDTVLRIRALQDVSPSQAVSFIIELRSILREIPASFDLALLDSRIDQLTLAAFDKYTQCRDQICAVRLHEMERLIRTHRVAGKVGV